MVGAAAVVPVGLAVLGAAVLWTGKITFPARFKEPSDVVNQELKLNELSEFDPPVFKLGLVGTTLAGKSDLLDRIGNRPSRNRLMWGKWW
jgi:hypothetical protein